MPGAWANVKEVPPSLLPINQNQTLYVTKLTSHDMGAPNPEKVAGLKSVEEVLDQYKPEKGVLLSQEDEGEVEQLFTFRKMGDFTQPGLINQSPLLQSQAAKIQDLKKINLHLRSNKMLQKVLQNAESRRLFREMIEQMLSELA
ncbi:hypothetical protein CLV60_108299 [Dyadobacter jiangsuensis]|uniref:Type VI secretion system (T6SS) VipA/Hcp2 family protein n=2 Tax=Dyadobacter jiangsuensis TaxID=1591085 RepID=A0A2P8G0E5_9BACT|nr:hypothetical protein CLV60_108299 [Dyadobacter jiangsuensis]